MSKQPKLIKKQAFRTPKGSANTRIGADVLLRLLRSSSKKWAIDGHHLLPAYVASVCAAIEHRLNEAYISHFSKLIGRGYEPYVAPYLRLKIEEKFGILIPLISDFQLEVNRKDKRVQFLYKLFRLRNRLIHQVPHLIDAEIEEYEQGYARITYMGNQFRYSHAHPEWTTIQRKDLVAIQAALNFWMPWLYDIQRRVRYKRFNHKQILQPVAKDLSK